jgi:hypothetical protein
VSRLQERLEDMEDLMELRAAVERNAEKPATLREQGQSRTRPGLTPRDPRSRSSFLAALLLAADDRCG